VNKIKRVLVPRFTDAVNVNAQNLNAKSLLTRFRDEAARWSAVHYYSPQEEVVRAPQVELTPLLPKQLWKPHLASWYQRGADAIFYPGPTWADEWGLRIRTMTGRKVPLISTLEGLVGTPERERQLREWAGHPVYCQAVSEFQLRRLDYIYQLSDHIIAISPFLARMGSKLYGDKFSVQMLGVDGTVFRHASRSKRDRPLVINVANLRSHKRPEAFLELASRCPAADFVWYGDGDKRAALLQQAEARRLANLRFPGTRTPVELADEFRSATLLAMPSRAEGVPKVTQEAAACGLPIVIFGYYESPTVIDGQNGFVVWTDEEFFQRIETLLSDPKLAANMGARSAEMARAWNWDTLAPEWERQILQQISH
jgi:glycosyltransferase involved in cell wall biosynthesis